MHDIHCIVLATAQELLHHGLFDLLQGVKAESLRCEQLVSVIISALNSQLPHLQQVFTRIFEHMSQNSASSSATLIYDNLTAVQWRNSVRAELRHCKVIGDSSKGRAILCTHGVGPGIELLSEPPLVFTASLKCGCRGDCLLVEHLRMATSLASAPSPLDDVRSQLFSGLPGEAAPKEHQTVWPFAFRCLMATAAVVHSLACPPPRGSSSSSVSPYSAMMMPDTAPTPPTAPSSPLFYPSSTTPLPASYLPVLAARSTSVFLWCARLPPNTHRITSLCAADSGVQLQEYGYALFPSASAANHHCAAPCILRYVLPAAAAAASPSYAQAALRSLRIEIVAQASLRVGEEVCVSYLPPRMSLAERRANLRKTYLFACTCSQCLLEACTPRSSTGKPSKAVQKEGYREGAERYVQQAQGELSLLSRQLSDLLLRIGEESHSHEQSAALQQLEGQINAICLRLEDFHRTLWPSLTSSSSCSSSLPSSAEKSDPLLHPLVSALSLALDLHARVLLHQQQFRRASSQLRRSADVRLAAQLCGPTDEALARDRVKLAEVCMLGGQTEEAREAAAAAWAVLRICADRGPVGEGLRDPDLLSAERILAFTARAKH